MATICGVDCTNCDFKQNCRGCLETGGRPLGGSCPVAECFKKGGQEAFCKYKAELIKEFNSLGIEDMPVIAELNQLCGAFVNME